MSRVSPVLAFAHRTGIRLAEVGFLLLLFAGVWLAAAQIPQFKFGAARTIVAGLALPSSGLLPIIATRRGDLGPHLAAPPSPPPAPHLAHSLGESGGQD